MTVSRGVARPATSLVLAALASAALGFGGCSKAKDPSQPSTESKTDPAAVPDAPAAKKAVSAQGTWLVEGGRAAGYLRLDAERFLLRAAPDPKLAPTIVMDGTYTLVAEAADAVMLNLAVERTRAEVGTHFITLEPPPIRAAMRGSLSDKGLTLPLNLEGGAFAIPADASHRLVRASDAVAAEHAKAWAARDADPRTMKDGPAAPAEPQPVVEGTIRITSTPPGASVWVGGKDTALQTPCDVTVNINVVQHLVLKKAGHRDYPARTDSGVFQPDDSGQPLFKVDAQLAPLVRR